MNSINSMNEANFTVCEHKFSNFGWMALMAAISESKFTRRECRFMGNEVLFIN